MAAQLRAVRARIRAVKSIAKITRAQELIASSRIVRAQQRMRTAEPYARELTTAVEAVVSRSTTISHPMITEPASITRAAVLVLTSDGGFAGAYNANVLREASRLRQRNSDDGIKTLNYVAGRKGIGWHRFRDLEMVEQWSGFSAQPTYADAERLATAVLDAFEQDAKDGGVDEIYLVSTEFVSMLTQRPAVVRLLPMQIEEREGERPGGALPSYEYSPDFNARSVAGASYRTPTRSRSYFPSVSTMNRRGRFSGGVARASRLGHCPACPYTPRAQTLRRTGGT